MADAELVRVLDYILNRSDANSIEAIAAAVVRRKRDLSLFSSAGLPDPKRWAQKVSSEININASLEGIRTTVRNMVSEMLKREAPELSDAQREELLNAWVPDQRAIQNATGTSKQFPADVLATMVHQFIAFSSGTMDPKEDTALRKELGSWPERYWESFPPLIRSLITDYLNGIVSEAEFASKLRAGLQMVSKS